MRPSAPLDAGVTHEATYVFSKLDEEEDEDNDEGQCSLFTFIFIYSNFLINSCHLYLMDIHSRGREMIHFKITRVRTQI